MLHPTIARVTDRIRERSAASRSAYLARMAAAAKAGEPPAAMTHQGGTPAANAA